MLVTDNQVLATLSKQKKEDNLLQTMRHAEFFKQHTVMFDTHVSNLSQSFIFLSVGVLSTVFYEV